MQVNFIVIESPLIRLVLPHVYMISQPLRGRKWLVGKEKINCLFNGIQFVCCFLIIIKS